MSRRKRHTQRLPPDSPTPRDRTVAITETFYYQGPLPPPEVLKKYNEAHPNATAIILHSFEEEGKHRRKIQSAIVEQGIVRARRGQVFAFIIAMTAVAGGVFLLLLEKSIGGLSTIVAGVGVLVTAFLAGRIGQTRRVRKEIAE